jgi:hypothetical protein
VRSKVNKKMYENSIMDKLRVIDLYVHKGNICKDICVLIHTEYWKIYYDDVIQSIKKIKYSSNSHISNMPSKMIIIDSSVIFIPDSRRLLRYITSYNKDMTRGDSDINMSTSCNRCEFESTSIVEITLASGFTAPIWKYNGKMCMSCLKARKRKRSC